MATFTNIQTTETGQALLADVHAGIEELAITGIAFGSGIWTEEEYAARNLTALKNEVLRVPPSGGEQSGGEANITCVLTNATLEAGFALTELGIIAQKADGSEVLYMVDSVSPAQSTWISPASEYLMEIPVLLRIVCSSTSQVNIRIESTAPVTTEDLDRHNTAADAHPDIRQEMEEHDHDGAYYTQAQVNVLLAAKHMVPIGHIYPVPFPPDELPQHHYLPNGEGLLKTSDAGKALLSMSAAYKSAHRVTENATHVFLPNVFDAEGRGYFPRFVDGLSRLVGSIEGSASPNISGTLALSDQTNTACRVRVIEATGAFAGRLESGGTAGYHASIQLNNVWRAATFNAGRSSSVYRDTNEVRSSNYGFVPAIYLPPLEA